MCVDIGGHFLIIGPKLATKYVSLYCCDSMVQSLIQSVTLNVIENYERADLPDLVKVTARLCSQDHPPLAGSRFSNISDHSGSIRGWVVQQL